MVKRLIFFFTNLILLHIDLYSQADTILVYDLGMQTTSTILPVPFNSTVTSDFTSSSIGNMGNAFPLSQAPPAANLFTGANFSRLAHASNFFSLTDYPIRTVVKLKQYLNDSTDFTNTGMIVGPCFVMTSGFAVADFFTQNFLQFDSIRVFPAFNNGIPQTLLPSSKVKRTYIFKNLGPNLHNIALLELNTPIGLQTGWTGIGFNSQPNFMAGKVYHKFSYPAAPQPSDPSKVYNGDTLYYNYGSIDENFNFLIVNSSQAEGIPGQGGSTFMYTNNIDYYSVGLLTFSSNYAHYRITNADFYQLKNVMSNFICPSDPASLHAYSNEEIGLKLYPNPLNDEAILEFAYDPAERYDLRIINGLGQNLRSIPVKSGRIPIRRENLAPGIYLLQLSSAKGNIYTCKLLVE